MLQKMGWKKGKGLGKNEDGSTLHIKVKKKEDSQGLGLDEDIEGTKTLMKSANVFDDILKDLNEELGNNNSATKKKTKKKKKKRKGTKVLATGAKYKKRMLSKQVSSYDKASLAMILGKRPDDFNKSSVSSRGRTRSLSFEAKEAKMNKAIEESLKEDKKEKKKKKKKKKKKRVK